MLTMSQRQPTSSIKKFGLPPALAGQFRRAQRFVHQSDRLRHISEIGLGASQYSQHVRSSNTATGRCDERETLLHQSDALGNLTRLGSSPSRKENPVKAKP
jgi:hypothetical protein